MEPRPPRPRTPQPAAPAAPPQATRLGGPPPAAPGYESYPYAPAGGLPAPPMAAELLPRQQRRRQQAWRGVAVFVVALALIAGLGWVFRRELLPNLAGDGAGPTATTTAARETPPAVAASPGAAATPTALPAVANLLATATPTVAPARPTAAPTATPNLTPAAAGANANGGGDPEFAQLVDLLPAPEQVPAGLAESNTAERSEPEVVDSLGGTDEQALAEARQLLDDWGWEGNAFRDFTGQTEAGTYALNVSVHRFASDAAADDALTYFSDIVLPAGYTEAEVEPIGDAARLLVGAPNGDPTSVVYFRVGPLMYRVGGTASAATNGDPTPDVIAVAKALAGR